LSTRDIKKEHGCLDRYSITEGKKAELMSNNLYECKNVVCEGDDFGDSSVEMCLCVFQ
jgi:hypothetical protein